jgi:hypothetical protein
MPRKRLTPKKRFTPKRFIPKGPFPLLLLPRELRDQILEYVLVPKRLAEDDSQLAFCSSRAKDGSMDRHIIRNKNSPFNHPIRRVSKQLYDESTDALRRLYSGQSFTFGQVDSWLMYLILQDMSKALCAAVSAVTINAAAFEPWNGGKELWSGNKKGEHIGELMLRKLPNLRRVQIWTPPRTSQYEIERFPKFYNICKLCERFFSRELEQGRIERLDFIIKREVENMTCDKDILPTDPAYVYFAATTKPWNEFKSSKTFIEEPGKSWGPPDGRGEPAWYGCEPSRTWTVAYERRGTKRKRSSNVIRRRYMTRSITRREDGLGANRS